MDGLFSSIVVVCVAIVVFLALREFWCWYWKINVAIESLLRIEVVLTKQLEQSRLVASSSVAVIGDRRERLCPACSRPILADARVCKHCRSDVVPLE